MWRERPARVLVVALVASARLALAYEGGVVVHGGTVSGRVRVSGEVQPLPPQRVYKHVAECGETVRDDRLVMGPDGALQFAVVSLNGVTKGKPVTAGSIELRNRNCAFVPHVITATVGQTLDIVNEDFFLHDAHAWLGQRTLFNLAIPRGRTVRHKLADAGLIHINCNVRHTWMHAYLFVADHPYHTATRADGTFTLADVPPGTWRLTAWHEMLGAIEWDVTVPADGAATADITFPAVAPAAE